MIKLVICLFLATHIHAGITRFRNVTRFRNKADSVSTEVVSTTYIPFVVQSPSYFDADKLTKKLSAYNLTFSDIEQLGGNVIGSFMTKVITPMLLSKGVLNIARAEFREALNFGPIPSIRNQNKTEPNEEEFASAPTLEAYYNLKETRSRSIMPSELFYNAFVMDSNMPPAIAFLDKKFPSIRILFRRKIQEVLRSNQGKMNREEIDRWISGVSAVHFKSAQEIYDSFLELKCED